MSKVRKANYAPLVIGIGNKKTQRKKSKQLLKKIVNTFNYENEPHSINTEYWIEGKW